MDITAQTGVRRRSMARLLLGTAMAALGGTAAYAQGAVETVTVTGTTIHGQKPVGTNLITIDTADIAASGAQTTAQLLATVPQLNNFGGAGQGGTGATNPNNPVIHSLGNSASNSTLVLVDGHRIATGGTTYNLVDPSVIPTNAIQNVEILPDGASAIYGSDAVAGVLNFHLRKNYSGWETSVQSEIADKYNGFNFGQLFGQDWGGGGFIASYNYSNRSRLMDGSRSFITARQDLRLGAADPSLFTGLPAASTYAGLQTVAPNGQPVPYPSAGGNFQNFACPVATISTSSSATVSTFAYPYAGTLAIPRQTTPTGGPSTGICDNLDQATAVAGEVRNQALVGFHQALTSKLSVDVDLVYSAEQIDARSAAGSLTNVAVFNPNGTGDASFGTAGSAAAMQHTNPFYVPVPGAPANANSEFVTIDMSSLLASQGLGQTKTKTDDRLAFATLGVDYNLFGDWLVSLGATLGAGNNSINTSGGLNSTEALLALNGTTNAAGTAPTTQATSSIADIYGFNTLTAVTRPLTTLNALDVWHPAGPTNKTNPFLLRSLADSKSLQVMQQTTQDLALHTDGSIGDFWGAGPIKAAFGGEFYHSTYEPRRTSSNSGGPASQDSNLVVINAARTVYAAYMEFVVPVVGPSMNVPLMQSLTFDAAARYDQYSDFGATRNPKFAVSWDIIDGIEASASFGTSFTAPQLANIGEPGTHRQASASLSANNNGAANGLVVLFNDTRPFNDGAGIAGTFVSNPFACAAAGSTPVTDATGSTNATLSGGVYTNAAGCKIVNQNGTNSQGVTLFTGNPNLKPEIGQSYSANLLFDDFGKFWDPLEGLRAQVTYYQAKFVGAATNIGIITSQTNAGLPRLTTFAPANCTGSGASTVCTPGWAPSNAVIQNLLVQAPLTNALPSTIYSIQDNSVQNAFTLWQDGLDFSINYRLRTDNYGNFTFGLNGNEILRASQQNGAGTPVFDTKGGLNGGRFADDELTGRANVNWQLDSYTVNLAYNYEHPYHNGVTTFPFNLPGPGRAANFQNVSALQTFDLTLNYILPDNMLPYGLASGTSVNMVINNILDTPPPFEDASRPFSVGNPIGRLITLAIRKKM